MTKRLANKLATVRERRRLTAEYLEWARGTGSAAAIESAEKDLVRHEAQIARLERQLAMARTALGEAGPRALARDMVPAAIFVSTAFAVTWLSRWDAGLVGLVDGLAAAVAYLYFAKDTGRLRL